MIAGQVPGRGPGAGGAGAWQAADQGFTVGKEPWELPKALEAGGPWKDGGSRWRCARLDCRDAGMDTLQQPLDPPELPPKTGLVPSNTH